MTEDHRDTPDSVEAAGRPDVEPDSTDEIQAYHKTALQTSHPETETEANEEAPGSRDVSTLPPGDAAEEILIDGRYQLHEQLGEGGMGSVFRATHVLMDKPVAVKLIHGELAHMPEVVKRFEREARSASRLTDPHIITVTDFGRTDDGTLYLVMELLDGEPLADRLEKTPALPVVKAIDVSKQILKGLAHAHEAGVVHRDLKPENVMLVVHGDETDFAKVFDFGIAKLASGAGSAENLTQSGLVVGTPGYLSPEQALGEGADHRADLYAVGVMLYEMLAGTQPFTGESAMDIVTAHLTSPIPSLPRPERFPDGLQEIIERGMAKRPAERFESAEEFLVALDAIDTHVSSRGDYALAPVVEKLGRIAAPVVSKLAPVTQRLAPLTALISTRLARLDPFKRRIVLGIFGALALAAVIGIFASFGGDGDTFEKSASIDVVKAPNLDDSKEAKIKELFDQADSQIRVGLPGEARVTIKEALRLSPKQPIGHLLLGHALFLTGNRGDAMKSYGRALVLDKSLTEDVRLGEHLEEGLKWEASRDKAARILAEFGGKKGIEMLASKANSAASKGDERRAARKALLDVKESDSIDWLTSLTADFNGTKSCKKRKKIVVEMEKTGNPEFLPLLKANLPSKKKKKKTGLFDSFKRRTRTDKTKQCIKTEVKHAIMVLTAIKEGKRPRP
ncbi:MAG: protein kinase [Deltaproteobacteria bacterium]|nr:protein kinase [Deltaproteobacteria bacterium]